MTLTSLGQVSIHSSRGAISLIKVSAILCHHKGTELVRRSIDSLLAQKHVEMEIIVVTSTNQEFEGARTAYVPGGPAHKRNVGLRYASHPLIAFFDDDIEAHATAVYDMAKVLTADDKTGMVFGKLLNMEHPNILDEAGSFLTSSGFLWARCESGAVDHGQYNKMEPVLAGKSAACMIKRRVFTEIGMFDASYEILGEETDLAWRVWLAGYRVLYVPQSVTLHAFNTRFKPPDMYTPARVYYNGCRNYLTMLYTNLGKRRWIIPVLTHLLVWSSAALGMFLTGKRSAAKYIIYAIFYFFRNICYIWRKRYKTQRILRKVSDRDLMPIIMRNPPLSYYLKRFVHYIKTGRHG